MHSLSFDVRTDRQCIETIVNQEEDWREFAVFTCSIRVLWGQASNGRVFTLSYHSSEFTFPFETLDVSLHLLYNSLLLCFLIDVLLLRLNHFLSQILNLSSLVFLFFFYVLPVTVYFLLFCVSTVYLLFFFLKQWNTRSISLIKFPDLARNYLVPCFVSFFNLLLVK